MSNQLKLRSTQPQNTIRGGITGVHSDRVYQTPSNMKVPLSDVMYSNDQTISLTTFNQRTTSMVKVDNVFRLIKQIIFTATLDEAITVESPAYTLDYKLIQHLDTFSYKFAGAEKINMRPWSMIQEAALHIPDKEKLECYRKSTGRVYCTYPKGHTFSMILPLPNALYDPDPNMQPKPLPLHLLGQGMELQFTFGDILKLASAEIQIMYGDFPYTESFSNTPKRYLTALSYSNEYKVSEAPQGTKRLVRLGGLRPGETKELWFHYAPSGETTNTISATGTSGEKKWPPYYSLPVDYIDQRKYCMGLKLNNIRLLYLNQEVANTYKDYDLYKIFTKKNQSLLSEVYGYHAKKAKVSATTFLAQHPLLSTPQRVNSVDPAELPGDDGGRTFQYEWFGAKHSEEGNYINAGVSKAGKIGYTSQHDLPENASSYFYCINLSELGDEYTKNEYSLGVDAKSSDWFLEFTVDSDAPNIREGTEAGQQYIGCASGTAVSTKQAFLRNDNTTIVPPKGVAGSSFQQISPKEALDAHAGTIYMTQRLTSIFQFLGSTCQLIQ